MCSGCLLSCLPFTLLNVAESMCLRKYAVRGASLSHELLEPTCIGQTLLVRQHSHKGCVKPVSSTQWLMLRPSLIRRLRNRCSMLVGRGEDCLHDAVVD